MSETFLDITGDVCPMTFVRAKLAVENLVSGQQLRIRLNGGEPLENVPRSLQEEGCRILNLQADGEVFLLTVQKI